MSLAVVKCALSLSSASSSCWIGVQLSPTSISCVLLFWVIFSCCCCCCSALLLLALLSADIDMKKDIETLIAEERADIILKYATVSLCVQHTEQSECFWFGPDGAEVLQSPIHRCISVCRIGTVFNLRNFILKLSENVWSSQLSMTHIDHFVLLGHKHVEWKHRLFYVLCPQLLLCRVWFSCGMKSSRLVGFVVNRTGRFTMKDKGVNSNVRLCAVWMCTCVGGCEYSAKVH